MGKVIGLRTYIAVIAASFFLSGCAVFDFVHRFKDISEQPKEGGVATKLPTRLSTIQPVVHVPLALIQTAANKAASNVLPIYAEGQETLARWKVEWPWPLSGCMICGSLDANWQYDARLFGPISVNGAENRLLINVPARIDGKVGLGGEIAKWLSLNGKSFKAAVDARFSSGFGMDTRFCPKIRNTDIKYRWTDGPSFQIIGRSCVAGLCVGPWDYNLERYLDPEIRATIPKLISELDNGLPCAPVRTELQKLWSQRSFPISVPYADRLFVNVAPSALHIPDVSVDERKMSITGRLDAFVSVDTKPIEEIPITLPPNTPAPITPGRFSLSVPISTKYYTFEALAKQEVVGRKFSSDTPIGRITVRPKKVHIYPSGDQIAIGVSFVLDYQYRLINTSGTVWFAGRPESTNNGKAIRISDIEVTRKFDNPIWTVASLLLEGNIRQAVADGFLVDLSKPLSNAERQLSQSLNQAGQGKGLTLQARDVSIAVGRILTANEALQVEGLFDAIVDATMAVPSP